VKQFLPLTQTFYHRRKFLTVTQNLPVTQIDAGIGFRVVCRLLDELQEQLVDEAVLLHGLVKDGLD
jgi:hypothetical protein